MNARSLAWVKLSVPHTVDLPGLVDSQVNDASNLQTHKTHKADVWRCEELEADFPKPGKHDSRRLFILRKFLSGEEVEEVLHRARALDYSKDLDSVDHRPTFERVILDDARFLPDAGFESLLSDAVQRRLLPYVRWRYSCPNPVVCQALLRRYLPDERRSHPTHFDGQAFCTVVVGLNPDDFEGGLYVQASPHVSSAAFVYLPRGDAAVHQFDLQHGVRVLSGVRYSLIFWLKDSLQACLNGSAPWYNVAAEKGDPDAQLNIAGCLEEGLGGYDRDLVAAARWYSRAAEAGQTQAQVALGRFYMHGIGGIPVDPKAALYWWRIASNLGDSAAQRRLSYALLRGPEAYRNKGEGERWLYEAALQDDRSACVLLARLLAEEERTQEALPWIHQAADLGDEGAQYEMAVLSYLGDLVPCDLAATVAWLLRSAGNGYARAQAALGGMLIERLPDNFRDGADERRAARESVRWLQKASDQNEETALYNFGLAHARGIGVRQDAGKAYAMLNCAALFGSQEASDLLNRTFGGNKQDGYAAKESLLEAVAFLPFVVKLQSNIITKCIQS